MNPIFLKEHYDYFIYTLADLQELQTRINNGTENSGTRFLGGTTGYAGKKFKLMNDINMNNNAWTGIGLYTNSTTYTAFKGVFDGGNHKLYNFNLYNTIANANNAGFFITCDSAIIRNLTISGSITLTNNIITGVFCATAFNAKFEKCVNEVNATLVNVPAMINRVYGNYNYITDCYNFGNFTSTTYPRCAGILAYVSPSASVYINRCANFGTMNGTNNSYSTSAIGGILVNNSGYAQITNCLNTGTITSSYTSAKTGGIYAGLSDAGNTTIQKTYNIGSVYMRATNSGQISVITPYSYSDNFYDSTLYSGAYGVYNGVAKTTAELTDGSNLFSDTANWVYENGYYPRLNNWLKNDSRVLTALAV